MENLEAPAFSGREIGGDDDVLAFFVGRLVDVDLTRQPAAVCGIAEGFDTLDLKEAKALLHELA